MELGSGDFLAAIKRRIPAAVRSRISPAAKQRARDLVERVERYLSRAFPTKPPIGAPLMSAWLADVSP